MIDDNKGQYRISIHNMTRFEGRKDDNVEIEMDSVDNGIAKEPLGDGQGDDEQSSAFLLRRKSRTSSHSRYCI
jgi:hypothetical protein